ncbi:MAG TPA: hypothetical protein VL752_17020 [Acidisoma sp.]|uniref:hypothetical protein n=1 Tax=Acidisoma sp. TaxID=1872115 RepID=UPI002C07AD28|nr:hypothetical protein [Acidisoma sp.]HTI02655.1 hypothetical protein [Acidisoma sp.]
MLLLAAGLLSACSGDFAAAPPAAETAAATPAPGTITTHIDGRASFFMGVGGSN